MKLLVAFLLFILFSIKVSAQETSKPINDSDIVVTPVQIEADFVGGKEGWTDYLINNLNTDAPRDHGAPAGKYKVIINFIVDKEGNIKDVSTENNPGYGAAEEAIRVVKNSPRWKPAVQDGRNVTYRHKQVISFIVQENGYTKKADSLHGDYIIPAEFGGGAQAWQYFLEHNLNSDIARNNGAHKGRYTVRVSFIVQASGKLSDLKLTKDPGFGAGDEVVRLMKISPNWKPAIQNGLSILSHVSHQITFVVN